MTLTKQFSIILFITGFCIAFTSCDSSSSSSVPDPDAVPLLTVEAATNFDLSSRSDWELYVGGHRYGFEVTEDKLVGTPYKKDAPFVFTKPQEKVFIILRPKNYGKTRLSAPPSIPANLEDQHTPDEFMKCDLLAAEYQGEATGSLENITLFHQNALLIFNTINVPAEAEIRIRQIHTQDITPLQDSEDPTAYKAIVFPENALESLMVYIKHNEKIYKQSLNKRTRKDAYYPEGIGTSTTVEFTVRITEADELVIEDLKQTPFSKKWPIDR